MVLAAGKGSRMQSPLPKPLVLFRGQPMLLLILDALQKAGVNECAVVVGFEGEKVIKAMGKRVKAVWQREQNGTAHAVEQARELGFAGKDVLVFVGDAPLIRPQSIQFLSEVHTQTQADCTFLTANFEETFPYARVIRQANGRVSKVLEERDASETEKKSREYLSTHFIFKGEMLEKFLPQVQPHPVTGERYLTDLIGLILDAGGRVETAVIEDYRELVGLNTQEELRVAENYEPGRDG